MATVCDPALTRRVTIDVHAKAAYSFSLSVNDSVVAKTGVDMAVDFIVYGKP